MPNAAKTVTLTWLPYPANKPAVVYLKGEYDSKVPYFVVLTGKQITHLIWHAHVGGPGRWETWNGKPYHGVVLYFATQPDAP